MADGTAADGTADDAPRTNRGPGRILVAVYAVFALAATARSVVQLTTKLHEAPLAYLLSAFAAVVYIVATVSLALGWRRAALLTICFELAGVLVVGTISVIAPHLLGLQSIDPFGRTSTVWSVFGAGYLGVPLVLPVLGLLYLRRLAPASVGR